MIKISFSCSFERYDSRKEIPAELQPLIDACYSAKESAYAPYSGFSVGAALLLENGAIVIGNNQENAAYPSGLCAERVAIFQAGAIYPEAKIVKLAITAASDTNPTKSPIPPCGACRQAISEYEVKQDKPIVIYFMGESGKVIKSDSLANLLPLVFDKSVL